MYTLTLKPLTAKQRKELINDDGEMTFIIPIDIWDLINWDLEYLNDTASEMAGVVEFSDIDYHVVGHERDEVHLQVRGVVEEEE